MEEECSDASKRRKIESTVLHILKASDLETATEFSVRSAAAVSLGFELSCLSHRRLVRQLIHSFLLSTAADILRTDSLHRINDRKNTDENADSDTTQPPQQPLSDVGVEMEANYNGKVICKLSDKRRVTIHDMSGTAMIAIRDFYIKDGNMLPKKGANSGLSLTSTQWSSFRNSFPSIQEAIFKLESESRMSWGRPWDKEPSPRSSSLPTPKQVTASPLKSSAVIKSSVTTWLNRLWLAKPRSTLFSNMLMEVNSLKKLLNMENLKKMLLGDIFNSSSMLWITATVEVYTTEI